MKLDKFFTYFWLIIVIMCFILVGVSVFVDAAHANVGNTIGLEWDANTEPTLAGYDIHVNRFYKLPVAELEQPWATNPSVCRFESCQGVQEVGGMKTFEYYWAEEGIKDFPKHDILMLAFKEVAQKAWDNAIKCPKCDRDLRWICRYCTKYID